MKGVEVGQIPDIVSADVWKQEREELPIAEKEATRLLDNLAARRRRLPMVEFDNARCQFDSPQGPETLIDLFGERPQLVTYQFMDNGPDDFCPGCTHFTNNVVDLSELANNDVSWTTVSHMPLGQIERYKSQMGWTVRFVSSHGTTFAADCGVVDWFMLSVFFREGTRIFRTYSTTARGVDRRLFVNNILDLIPYGRQEYWEDSPVGWPEHPTYG